MPPSFPLITIGICCYNSEHTILDSLYSALSQTWPSTEIIIVDDGSTDSTYQLLTEVNHPSIRVFRHAINRGTSSARNTILRHSTGDLICFFDSDDTSHPFRLYLQYQSLLASGYPHDQSIASVCGMTRTYTSGFVRKFLPLGATADPPTPTHLYRYLLFGLQYPNIDYGFCVPTSCLLVPTHLIRSAGLFDTSLTRVEDVDLVLRLSQMKIRFTSVRHFLVFQLSTVASYKSASQNLKSELSVIHKHSIYLKRIHFYTYAVYSTYLRYAYFDSKYLSFARYLLLMFFAKPFYAFPRVLRSSCKRLLVDLQILSGITLR